MTSPLPNLDDRTYRQLFEDLKARIPVHNPEWTHHADGDPGITILQLFAFLAENILYRANKIPERNRLRFLSLLGIGRREAKAAEGLVTFEAPRGRPAVTPLAPGVELAAGKVPFTTRDGLEVLPIEARVYHKATLPAGADRDALDRLYRQAFAGATAAEAPEYYEVRPFEPSPGATAPHALDLAADSVDDAAWIALLARTAGEVAEARAAIAHRRLTLGFVPAQRDGARTLGGAGDAAPSSVLRFSLPASTALPEEPSERLARWSDLTPLIRGAFGEAMVVELPLPGAERLTTWTELFPTEEGTGEFPPVLEDDALAERVITWLRVKQESAQVPARFGWIGINAARVVQRASVSGELAGRGTGEPDQAVKLVRTPVIAESVELSINGARWRPIDDLYAAPEEPVDPAAGDDVAPALDPRVFTIDRDSGEVRFGDGRRGARPPRGAVITARYEHGGGDAGNVAAGAITSGPGLPPGVRVQNPIPTWGGRDPESAAEAERRIPTTLRHRERLVTEADYLEITRDTPGVEVGRVEVLPLFDPQLPGIRAEGVVTLLVVPRFDRAQPEAPVPDQAFLAAVCAHLEPRRLVTTELHVLGPEYVRAWVSVGIAVIPGRDTTDVVTRVTAELTRFFSPLEGGFEGAGWPLGRDVDPAELAAVVARVAGVAKVSGLLLGDASGNDRASVPIDGRQLPHLVGLAVRDGDPRALEALRGEVQEAPAARRPVPVIPEVC